MENFALLGSLAYRLHQDFVQLYFVMLPVFFALAIALDWFRNPQGSPDFLDSFKRAIVATILVIGFQEISDAILTVTSGIADRISDMSGLDSIFQMAGQKVKNYTLSPMTIVLGFNDMLVGIITFVSYIVLYFAQYITVAVYHFMWIFLSILAPLLMLFHLFRGTSQIPVNLFKSMIEVASYKIVWAVLSAMLSALAFGNAYVADGNYLTVIVLNFVIAVAMLGTPMIVKSLAGGGLSSMGETLGVAAVAIMTSVPSKVATLTSYGLDVLNSPKGFASHMGGQFMPKGRFEGGGQRRPPSSHPAPPSV